MKFLVIFWMLTWGAGFSLRGASAPPSEPRPKEAVKKGTAKTKKQTAPAKNPIASPESQIPKGATKISDYQWRYVDKEGKAWIYKRTPFGVAKLPEEQIAEDKKQAAATTSAMEARDVGDSVEFSRQTPFGLSKWTKKKTDLDESEKAAWETAQNKNKPENK